MVLDALEDAGLTLDDVDGVCHPDSAVAFAEYLGVHPTFVESTMTGGSSYEVHVEHAAAAIAAGVCDVVVSVYASTPRSDRTRKRPAHRTRHGRAEPHGRMGAPVRPAPADGPLRAGRRPPHARLRHDGGAAGLHRGADTGLGRAEPAGPLPRPDHDRRRARLPAAGEPPAPARLLPGHRRRRRVRHDQRGTRPDPAQAARLRPRRRHLHRPHGRSPRCPTSPRHRARCRAPAPSPWPASARPTSTSSWATTASPSPRSCTWRTSASAPRARAAPSRPRAASGPAARSP